MKKFDCGAGFISTVTDKKLKLEIPISNLVCAFECAPNNMTDTGGQITVKRGKRKEFAEWVAEYILDEANSEDGAAHIHKAFDSVFDLLLEGYEDGQEFLDYAEEEEYED